MSLLVVNADDGGLAASSDDAILRCARAGLVRSATVVAGGPTAEDFVRRARGAGLDLGLHLNLTQGAAVAGPARTLTDADGRFLGPKARAWERAARGELDPAEVLAEVRAQWERLRALGAEPTHVDGHNHVHLFPAVREALKRIAGDVFVRVPQAGPPSLPAVLVDWARAMKGPWRTLDRFTGYRFSERADEASFLEDLGTAGSSVEFMVHPGSRPGSAFSESPLRDREAALLCAPELRSAVERRGFRVASFAELPCA